MSSDDEPPSEEKPRSKEQRLIYNLFSADQIRGQVERAHKAPDRSTSEHYPALLTKTVKIGRRIW